jgi:hypothetical protein
MNTARPPIAGKTRSCPHCKATILDSASICPQCQHHLRFDPGADRRAQPSSVPLKVEGRIRHPQAAGTPWEYSVVLAITNERGGMHLHPERRSIRAAADVRRGQRACGVKRLFRSASRSYRRAEPHP